MACKSCKEPNWWDKVKSFIFAIFSKRNIQLGSMRLARCQTHNHTLIDKKLVFTPCEYYIDKGNSSFCDACDCPQSGPWSFLSRLEYKTTLTKAKCPQERW